MSHFTFETEVNSILKMDAPITAGPQMRWQRKLTEASCSVAGAAKNESSFLNCSVNTSTAVATPGSKTPMKDLPSSGVPVETKTPSKTPHKPLITPLKRKATPGKSGKTPGAEDRFIPNRSSTQFELGHFLVTSQKAATEAEQQTMSPSKLEFQQIMSNNLNGGALNSKIISYGNKPPAAPEGFQRDARVLYSNAKTPGSCKKVTRHIPQAPERILDAPEILDDYYLNLLDWSVNNHLAVCLGSQVYIWNAGSGEIQQLMEMENQEEYVSSVAWAKEGGFLAIGTSPGVIQLWDVEKQKKLRTMPGHVARVGSLSWNSFLLSSGSRSGFIHHHDVRVADHQVAALEAHSQEVCGLKWSPDGKLLASGGNDNLLHIWQAQNPQPINTFTEHQAAVKALAWCPWQHSLLASGGGTADRHIRFWNCNTGSCLQSVDTKSQVCSLLWSSEYKELISGHGFAQNQLTIWKYPALSKVAELTGHTSRVLHMALSPDGTTVISAAADETLRLWKCFAVDPLKKKEHQKSSAKKDLNTLLNRQRLR